MTKPNKRVKVLIVDDSAVVRKVLSEGLSRNSSVEVVATAADPYIAREKIIKYAPDVLTLDVEMPRMDGITFMRKLSRYYPMPVIILSSLTEKGSTLAVEALAAGAVDVFCKPQQNTDIKQMCDDLSERIIAASKANVKYIAADYGKPNPAAGEKHYLSRTTDKVVAIGASTGGVQALSAVLSGMPADCPGIVIVQHMPANFTASFAKRLDDNLAINVRQASDGDRVICGQALIAPGDKHMVLCRSGGDYFVSIKDGPLVCHQRPSVDVLFDSVARYAGPNAVGAILTGMGADGAAGLLKMRQNGARTIAQDQETSVVFGMPKEAIKCGAAEHVAALDKVPEKILSLTACCTV